jgi:hypothetical protein
MVLQKLEKSGVILSAPERSALELHVESKEHPLSPKTSAEFLQLFLQGYNTSDIQKLNPGFKLGIIVAARIEHEWDRHKHEYINALMTQTRESVQKVQLEAVRFVSDALTVYRRILGDAFKRYIQSGKTEDLGEAASQINLKNYKEYVALFMALTGQGNEKKVSGEVHHTLSTGLDGPKTIDITVDGSDILKALDK